MSRYTIDLSGHTESMLFNYMKKNGIKLKSVGIKKCIEEVNNQENLELKIIEIDNKLNRLLYRENLNKKLLEQIFANMVFPINEDINKDECLKEFNEKNKNYSSWLNQFLKGVSVIKKEIIRRSVSIPKEIDEKIDIMVKEFDYTVKNDLYVELLELGILKYNEDIELKSIMCRVLKKIELLLQRL